MYHCNRIRGNRNSPLFTNVQFLAPNASAASCFNHLFLPLSLSSHATFLQSLPSSFNSSTPIFTLSFLHVLCVFSSIIIKITSGHFSTNLCLRAFYFHLFPPWAMSSTNLLCSFTPLPWFSVRELESVPCAGDGEGFVVFNIIADVARRLVLVTPLALTMCFCIGYTELIVQLWCRCIFCFAVYDSFHAAGWFTRLWLQYNGWDQSSHDL